MQSHLKVSTSVSFSSFEAHVETLKDITKNKCTIVMHVAFFDDGHLGILVLIIVDDFYLFFLMIIKDCHWGNSFALIGAGGLDFI